MSTARQATAATTSPELRVRAAADADAATMARRGHDGPLRNVTTAASSAAVAVSTPRESL
jgi:hypothetical protein